MNIINFDETISNALARPTTAISYSVSMELAQRFPERYVLETDGDSFELDTFIYEGHCTVSERPGVHAQSTTDWYALDSQLAHRYVQSWQIVGWQGNEIDILRITYTQGYCTSTTYWIIAANRFVAESFFRVVCELHAVVTKEVLVFQHGYWQRSKSLYSAIENATYDKIILAGQLKQQIHSDFTGFFAARNTYRKYNVPWKRGVLLIGPPGNGKTQMVRAVINAMQIPCLYVKSLSGDREDGHANVRTIFQRARETAPCFLVLEDLDSLVTDLNRSFFLNELDGFAVNDGIVVLATTNHPDRLDPAILERPSRFDRKYLFNLPEREQRLQYLEMWNADLEPDLRLSADAIASTAGATDGFSFAYLKELILGSIIEWIEMSQNRPMDEIVAHQVGQLREQMRNVSQPHACDDVLDCEEEE